MCNLYLIYYQINGILNLIKAVIIYIFIDGELSFFSSKCLYKVCIFNVSQESDGEKSDDNLVVDVSNEVQHSLAACCLFCYLIRNNKSICLSSLSVLTHHRIQCLLEEVPHTHLGRTGWTSVACWRRMLHWVLPPSPPPAAHLHPNPKRLIWWVIWVIIVFRSSVLSFLWVVFYF